MKSASLTLETMSMKNKQHRSKNKICFLKEKEDIMTEEAVWGLTRGNEGEEDEVGR